MGRRFPVAAGILAKTFGVVGRGFRLEGSLQIDLSEPSRATWREFFVIPKGAQLWNPPNSFYYEDDYTNNYLGKTRILESRGYVIDVTPGETPMFQMTEEFVAFLRSGRSSS